MSPEHAATNLTERRLLLWGPVVAYAVLIFALSSISAVPSLPGRMNDKVAHTLLYSGLGFLAARAIAGGLPRASWLRVLIAGLLISAAYGLSDETHQLFVPNRQFDLLDLTADTVGGGLGAVAFMLWGILRRVRDAA